MTTELDISIEDAVLEVQTILDEAKEVDEAKEMLLNTNVVLSKKIIFELIKEYHFGNTDIQSILAKGL